MNKDLIEKLKNNQAHIIFADMTEEEQKCLANVGNENLMFLQPVGTYGAKKFGVVWELKGKNGLMYPNSIYKINPDYQPEPEYVDLEIIKGTITHGDSQIMVLGCLNMSEFMPLHYLPILSDFEKFRTEDCPRVKFEDVAEIKRRKKIYARFRTPND